MDTNGSNLAGGPPQPTSAGTQLNVLAIVAFVVALGCVPVVPIVLGAVARRQVRATGEWGAGLALAAILLGMLGTLFAAAWVALVVLSIFL